MDDIVVISQKPYKDDFRRFLLSAFSQMGHTVIHIYVWDKIEVVVAGEQRLSLPNLWSSAQLSELIKLFSFSQRRIILTGMGGADVPAVQSLYEEFLYDIFIFDMYDDFLYGKKGSPARQQQEIIQKWIDNTDSVMVLSEDLCHTYKQSFFLDNASHLKFLNRNPKVLGRVIYIGSIDERVDFKLLESLALEKLEIDIWGRVHNNDRRILKKLDSLVNHPNVSFLGGFENEDLPHILLTAGVGLIPYKTPHALTNYVNTDKLYHYLNSGMRVLSSSIPIARKYPNSVTFIPPERNELLLGKVLNRPLSDWNSNDYTWETRANEFMNFFSSFKKFGENTPTGNSLKKLHLGAGYNVLPGWLNTDILDLPGVEFLDFSQEFPFISDTFEAAYCEHVIEHIDKITAIEACKEVFRTLKPGGWFRVVTPSLEQMFELIHDSQSDASRRYVNWFREYSNNAKATENDAFNAIFYNHGHRYIFSRLELVSILKEIGFVDIKITLPDASKNELFEGISGNGAVIGYEINRFEAFGVESRKPL